MSQGILPYQYEEEKNKSGMTSLAGLPLYLDLVRSMGLSESLGRHLHVRGEESQGWSDAQVVTSLILLNLAGGKLPSDDFGENAAWWQIMILALNLNAVMKQFALGDGWVSRRMKAIRFSLINLPGRVVEHSRQMFIRLARGHPSLELLLSARQKIAALCLSPPG